MTDTLFGRKWELQVYSPDGTQKVLEDKSFPYTEGVEPVQITFETYKPGYKEFSFADITLYNTTFDALNVLVEGMLVTLSSGYEDPSRYGQIFKGRLFQILWDRDNNVDTRMTLHCLNGKIGWGENFVSGSLAAALTGQTNLVKWMAQNATQPFPVASIPSSVKESVQPRGVVLFGSPRDYAEGIADYNNWQVFYDEDGAWFGDLSEAPAATTAHVVKPETGLIGIPQQFQSGVRFKTLLDPNIYVQWQPMQVQLQSTRISQQKRIMGQLPMALDWSGFYNVVSVRHIGDSRGNDWYTEATALVPAYGKGMIGGLPVGGTGIALDTGQ